MSDTDTQDASTPEAPTPAPASPWAELGPESFQLVRLDPLPTDRYTGARPLRFVQLGTLERHSRDHSLFRLSIAVPGQKIRKERNVLEVWADHGTRQIRFGPESGLQTEPANRGMGRFLAAQTISWAKRRWGSYTVEAFPLLTALNEDARLNRDRFLHGLGFTVSYQDESRLKAHCHAESPGSLLADWPQEKLQILSPLESAAMLQNADTQLQQQDVKIRDLDERLARLRRDDGSLRFTIACLVTFALFQSGLLIWIVTH